MEQETEVKEGQGNHANEADIQVDSKSPSPQAGQINPPEAKEGANTVCRLSRSERTKQIILARKARGLHWGLPRGSRNRRKQINQGTDIPMQSSNIETSKEGNA